MVTQRPTSNIGTLTGKRYFHIFIYENILVKLLLDYKERQIAE